MQIQDQKFVDPERILQQPYLLNQITVIYLQNLTNSTRSISWECIAQILTELNGRQIENEKFILLLNSLKHILLQTFPNVNGLKENRIYCWMGMIYAIRCGILIEQMQQISDKIEQNRGIHEGQNNIPSEQQTFFIKQLQKRIAYGLIISQIMIGLVENAGKQNTGNRVVYPELYRFIEISLQNIDKFIKPNIYSQIKQEDEDGRIKMTQVLKSIMKEKQVKKKKNKASQRQELKEKTISAFLIGKIVEVLERSFQISKKPLMKKLHIVAAQINKKLESLLEGYSPQNQGKDGKRSVAILITQYLQSFIEKEKEKSEEKDRLNLEQIEEQNKIIYTKQLTPKFVDEKNNDMHENLKKLRKKKKKLTKKIQSDARVAKFNKLQQQKIKSDVRNERLLKRQKKEMFVLQKQTEQAKKQHKKTKKIKEIQKGSKSSKFNSKKTGKFEPKRGGGAKQFGKTKKIRK